MTPVVRRATARIPTEFGEFTAVGYESTADGVEHVALVRGDVDGGDDVLVRVHSECLTGDVFGSQRCDCGGQLRAALAAVAGEERGLVIYSRGQEGRGIGLMRKLEAYALQDEGLDTVEANESMGFVADAREYSAAAAVLADLGVQSIRLLTNNPAKRLGLEASGTVVAELVPLVVAGTDESRAYLATKVAKLGHVMEAGDVASPSEGTEDA